MSTKKTLTPQRVLFEIVNFLLTAAFCIPIGAFLEQFFGYPEYRVCFLLCYSCLGYILGRYTMHSEANGAMSACAVATVAACLLMAFTLPHVAKGFYVAYIFMILLSGFLAVFIFFCARKAGYTIYGPLSISGILVHLAILLIFAGLEYSDRMLQLASIGATVFFLLSLYAFNAKGLRRSIHAGSTKATVSYPAGMQMCNFFLITGFIILALILSNISPLFVMFTFVFGRFLKFIIKLMSFVTGLFDRRGVATSYEEDEMATVAEGDSIFNTEPRGESSIVTTMVAIFAMACVVVLLILFLRWFFKKTLKKLGGMPRFMVKLKGLFAPPEEEDYVDETENLFTWKTLADGTKDSLKNLLKKVTERPQRFDDFSDPRMKIRFAFREILKKAGSRSIYRTPYELLAEDLEDDSDYYGFIDTYNDVRYNDSMPSDEQVQEAKRLMKQKF